jgi:photosystem II stability/assembly factor-like uncharacterized protein
VAAGALGSAEVSSDGGETWTAVGDRIAGSFRELHAATASVAYAGGVDGILARTTDGGQHWRNVSAPTSASIVGIAAPTPDRVFVLASDGSLQRSDNGGASYKLLDPGRMPLAIVALAGDQVVLVGPRGIRRSVNAGERFSNVTARAVRNVLLYGADRAGSAVVAFGPKHLLASSNSGAGWRRLAAPRKRTIRDASFVSASVGYVLDVRGRLWRTSDAGRHWKELLGVGSLGAYRVTFTDARNGWLAVGSFGRTAAGFVLRTSDGGERWRPQLVSAERVDALDSAGGTGYALSGSRSLFATTNGGDIGASRSLSLSTPRRKLRKPGLIVLTGRLGSAVGGERVVVSARRGGSLLPVVVTVASNGTFTTRWRVKDRAVFVAQALGDADHAGVGTAPLTVVVSTPKRK